MVYGRDVPGACRFKFFNFSQPTCVPVRIQDFWETKPTVDYYNIVRIRTIIVTTIIVHVIFTTTTEEIVEADTAVYFRADDNWARVTTTYTVIRHFKVDNLQVVLIRRVYSAIIIIWTSNYNNVYDLIFFFFF